MSAQGHNEPSAFEDGFHLAYDLSSQDRTTRVLGVLTTDPKTLQVTKAIEGRWSLTEILPVAAVAADNSQEPIVFARALVIEPGTVITARGDHTKPTTMTGHSSLIAQTEMATSGTTDRSPIYPADVASLSGGFRILGGVLCLLGDDVRELTQQDNPDGGVFDNAGNNSTRECGMGVAWSDDFGGPAVIDTRIGHAWVPLTQGQGTPASSFGIASNPSGAGGDGGAGGGAGGGGGAGAGPGGGGAAPGPQSSGNAAIDAASNVRGGAAANLDKAASALQQALANYTLASTQAATAALAAARLAYQNALAAYAAADDAWYVAIYQATYGVPPNSIANFSQVSKAIQDAGTAVIAAYNALVAANARVIVARSKINSLTNAAYSAQLNAALAAQKTANATYLAAVQKLLALGVQIENNGGVVNVGSAPTFGIIQFNPDGSVKVGGAGQ